MAETFLHELLQMQNSVHNPGERCGICLEEYGSLCRETGTIEVEIRLPCPHTVGSACIATWLRTNNTCPVCRREFFPAQARPFLEHGILEGQEDGGEENEDGDDERTTREVNDEYCIELGLGFNASRMSGLLVQKLMESPEWSAAHSEGCMIAVSVYMASHLAWEPRSPREIGAVVGVDAEHIQFTYDLLYPARAQLVDTALLFYLQNIFDEPPPLDWPAPGYEFAGDRIEQPALHMLRMSCRECCRELFLGARVARNSVRIAERFHAGAFMGPFSPSSITAVCIIMASCLALRPPNAERVAEAVMASEDTVRSAYKLAYDHRFWLVEKTLPEDASREHIECVLGLLPSPEALR